MSAYTKQDRSIQLWYTPWYLVAGGGNCIIPHALPSARRNCGTSSDGLASKSLGKRIGFRWCFRKKLQIKCVVFGAFCSGSLEPVGCMRCLGPAQPQAKWPAHGYPADHQLFDHCLWPPRTRAQQFGQCPSVCRYVSQLAAERLWHVRMASFLLAMSGEA